MEADDEFWRLYMNRILSDDKKIEMLKTLGFEEYIENNRYNEFFSHLHFVLTKFTMFTKKYSREAFKKGTNIGYMNHLSPTQKTLLKQQNREKRVKENKEDFRFYDAAVEIIDENSSGDVYGLEESFQGNGERNLENDSNAIEEFDDEKNM